MKGSNNISNLPFTSRLAAFSAHQCLTTAEPWDVIATCAYEVFSGSVRNQDRPFRKRVFIDSVFHRTRVHCDTDFGGFTHIVDFLALFCFIFLDEIQGPIGMMIGAMVASFRIFEGFL